MESKINLLRQENARLVAKNYELEVEIIKLRQIIEENAMCDNSLVVSEQPQNDKEAIVKVLPEVMVSNIDLSNTVNKKSIGDKIRKRRRKKKVQHKTIAKDSSLVTLDLTHCEEDFFMTSVKPITLLEQIIKELIPVTSKVVC
ncbi:hypothetical protein RhiirC2_781685 [Rhizophagus irregularis]|uniref:Uncharacterized protein n=1 Tax=Rhizophagus irregularis TaxID=588596 RepID=A0A2N1N4W3_9GLOM|nr:hypothetical protein RhiirC2_781685 [Rhizophagus irregularis]